MENQMNLEKKFGSQIAEILAIVKLIMKNENKEFSKEILKKAVEKWYKNSKAFHKNYDNNKDEMAKKIQSLLNL